MAAQPYGLIATFDTATAVYHAAEQVRDAGYRQWDCITPLPIHGLDKAMGVGRSRVPRISLAGGITGFCTGMSMIWYTDSFDYPVIVGGKPLFSPLFAFPVSYELTILFFIVIESADPRFNAAETRALLQRAGGRQIEELEA
jgi:Protein of unknown function (DUF3341)